MGKSREQFEAMAIKRGLSIDKKKDSWGQEKYKYDMIQIMWEGWQASRESLELSIKEQYTSSCMYDDPYANGFDDGVDAVDALLKINGVIKGVTIE